jgi:hypothetical protein
VRVEPSRHYEFSAHVLPGNGVREVYLRISWYPTSDASGPALSTSDSLERAGGPADAFVFLTTGGVQPPSAAASARLRVMLAPSGAAAASVVIDDVSFAITTAPTPTPTPSGTPEATGTPAATAPVPLLGAVAATSTVRDALGPPSGFISDARAIAEDEGSPGEELPVAVPTVVAEVAVQRTVPRVDSAPSESLPERSAAPGDPEESLPWAWLAGITLVVVGLGGAYVQNRQSPR